MRARLIAVCIALAGCGETPTGPFTALPVGALFEVDGLDAVAHVARDRYGVAHVYANSFRDLGFASGYVMAHDRLAQMEMLRRYASGSLAELYGETALPYDVMMRFFRHRFFADETWALLRERATTDPIDADLVENLERFADGVNAYVAGVQAGHWPIDPALPDAAALFAPSLERWVAWTPADSLMIARMFNLAVSWSAHEELALSQLDSRVRPLGDSILRDLLAVEPIFAVTPMASAPTTIANFPRPTVPPALLADARAFFAPPGDPALPLPPQMFMRPNVGSSAFAVGRDFTSAGVLANDLQVPLTNPSAFYPMHQIVSYYVDQLNELDVVGLFIPGVPVALAGMNGNVGWAPTIGAPDLNDIYLETLTTNGSTVTARHGTENYVVRKRDELIGVGTGGEIARYHVQTYETDELHGPIVPNHPPDRALSIRYSADLPTFEVASWWRIGRYKDEDLLPTLDHGPGFMMIDREGTFRWSAGVRSTTRPVAAQAWSAGNPNGAAAFFVLDGADPNFEWLDGLGTLAVRNPTTRYVVIADADDVGGTSDGDPNNDLPNLYTGLTYANGLRAKQIASLLEKEIIPLDNDSLARVHHDTTSTFGALVKDQIAQILGNQTLVAGYTDAQKQTIALARDTFSTWTLETPVGSVAEDSNSAATLLFNTWMVHFTKLALADELGALVLDDDRLARIVYRMLRQPAKLTPHATTNEPKLCGDTGCSKLVIDAALAAIAELGAGKPNWRWGARHSLRMQPLFPDSTGRLLLPRPEETENPGGFQLSGDMFTIDRVDGGWSDTTFTPQIGMAYRMTLDANGFSDLEMRLELPTGTIFDARVPHYRDLLEKSFLTRSSFPVPFYLEQIIEHGEHRWEFR